MEYFEYTTRGQIYCIKPEEIQPATGDNTGLSFTVESELISASPVIRISGTLESIWGLREVSTIKNSLILLGNLKIAQAIEQGEDLSRYSYMFISSDPIIGKTIEVTKKNLERELNAIKQTNQNHTYDEKRRKLNSLITSIYSILDEINNNVKNKTGNIIFTIPITNILNQLLNQSIKTKEEYHFFLLLIGLCFECLNISFLNSTFPSSGDTKKLQLKLREFAGKKAPYFRIDTIGFLTQVEILIDRHDNGIIPHIQVLKSVHGLRNTFPTHNNQSYIKHRKKLGLPENLPQDSVGYKTNYLDEILIIAEKFRLALETIRTKVFIIIQKGQT